MFRGGPVDSRGTGITSGLAGGGRVGYQPGGIVTLQDILAKTGAPMTGQQILDFAQSNQMNLGPNFKINPKSKFIPETVEVQVGEDVVEKPFGEVLREEGFQFYDDPNEKYLGSDDPQGATGDKTLDGGRTFTSNFGTNEQVAKNLEKKITDTTKTNEVSFSDAVDGDVTTVDENDLDSLIDRYSKLLGGDKARRRDVGDMLGRASAAFLRAPSVKEGFAEFIDAESKSGPSRTEKINQAAAMLGIKGEQAQKLYETKLKNQNKSGQLQKAVEYIKSINPGMDNKEALATYQRRPASLFETVGKYKKQDGVIMPSGITLAAGEWFKGDYKGELPTDGNIKEGDPAKGKKDGAYTDKAKGLIFVIEDEIVTDVNVFTN